MYIQVLVLSVLAVSSVTAFKGYDDSLVSYILEADECISHSGDPKLCKNYLSCADDFPKPLKDVFDECRDSVFPHGFGSCSNGQTLYRSNKKETKFEECFLTKVPQHNTLDSDDDKAVEKFKQCIYKYGRQCKEAQGTAT
ncbi:uncharacterized protein TNIN_415901 [Trichonephila inaurata madagascariensis]|uniref:Secreted protein n=1 Tax=Trichonephila inaurata madagascariensis TaxID=2747483 RepID=A0A8X7BVA6_9ARAC|nr:uncharacterized protein TNIN_415901 [Trichonephila inaurata madagascariensis]